MVYDITSFYGGLRLYLALLSTELVLHRRLAAYPSTLHFIHFQIIQNYDTEYQ